MIKKKKLAKIDKITSTEILELKALLTALLEL